MSQQVTRRQFLTTSAAGFGVASLNVSGAAPTPAPAGPMPVRPLGQTGQLVSIVAFGGGSRYYQLTPDEAEAERMIHRAIELGITYFDTAFDYGQNQESQKRYGKYLTPTYRQQIFLASKSGQRSAEGYLRQVDQSLKNLHTDHLDLLHFHAVASMEDVDQLTAPEGALKAARRLVDEKVIRFIGCSGHTHADFLIAAVDRIQPDVIQFPMNAAREADFQQRLLPHALKKGVGIMGMKVSGQEKLLGKGGATGPDLVRYSLSLSVSGMVIGMRGMPILESCCEIARSFVPMPDAEKATLEGKMAAAAIDGSLHYLCPGYCDGHWA